jgi:hypothetical protein
MKRQLGLSLVDQLDARIGQRCAILLLGSQNGDGVGAARCMQLCDRVQAGGEAGLPHPHLAGGRPGGRQEEYDR